MASKKTEKKHDKSWEEALGDGSFAKLLREARIAPPPSEKIKWEESRKGTTFTWTWKAVDGHVIVTRHVGYEPDAWLLHCYALDIEECVLGTKNIEEAKHEALLIVAEHIKKLMVIYNSIVSLE